MWVQVPPGALDLRSFSSVGQSAPLITDGSGVQVPQGPLLTMIGNTIIYRRKNTKEQICSLNDTFASLEEAMELYTYGYNLRKGDPKYAHFPAPEEVEAIKYL